MTIQEQLINKAKQSLCRYRVSAIGLDKKGRVVGSAINKPRFDKLHGGLHAEINLIRRYKTLLSTIIICRVGNGGNLLPIKACSKCSKVADKMNIRIISIREGVC